MKQTSTGLVHRRAVRISLKIGIALVLGFVLIRQFSGVDAGLVWAIIRNTGWGIGLVLVPATLTTLSDTFGWAACVLRSRTLSLLLPLFPLRLGCDALLNTVPAGVAVAETARPILLRRRCGGTLPEAIASCLLAKVNMAIAQAVFVLLVVVLSLGTSPAAFPGGEGGTLRALGIAVVILVAVLAGLVLIYTGPRLTQLAGFLRRIQWGPLQRILARMGPALEAIDGYVRGFGSLHAPRLIQSFAGFVAGWIFIGFESFVILWLLGARVPLWQALSLEAVASLLRIAFFFLPSALGAAEIAYASLIAAFGVTEPITVAAAFILVKRSRELLWILLGYSMFLLPRSRYERGPQRHPDRVEDLQSNAYL